MSTRRASHSTEIDAPLEVCFETIVDYETFPDWQQAAVAVEVLDRHDDGLGKVVDYHVDIGIRELRYRLDYHYERPHRVWWDFLEGDFARDIGGDYRFEPIGERTGATYSLSVQPAVPVPGFVTRRLSRELMRRSVADLKREAERRASGTTRRRP